MKTTLFSMAVIAMALLAGFTTSRLEAQSLRLVSTPDTTLVPAGAGGDSWAWTMSPDGRYVLFVSTANNLLRMSNGLPVPLGFPPSLNVYLRDRLYGTNALVSVNVSGVAGGDANSMPAGLSSDGRYVLVQSDASDLVPGDSNYGSDVFVRDLVGGVTIPVSVTPNGEPGNGGSWSPVITPDGRYVAFVSDSEDLVDGDTNGIADVFVRDLQNGTTLVASAGAISTTYSASSEAPVITADGRYVAFHSTATNLVPGGARAGSDIYIRDLQNHTTILASTYARTAVPSNSVSCFNHAFSADGHFLVYEAAGTYARFGTVLRYSLDTGMTDLAGTNAAVLGAAYEQLQSLDISADGRFIAYVANFGTTDGATTCIRHWDAQTGQSRIVSGNLSGSGVPAGSACDWPELDGSGRYVAFLSSSTNMVTNATPGEFHLYCHDTQNSRTTLLDADTNGVGSNISVASAPQLSFDGRFVLFECADGGLVPNDRNRCPDVFLRDLQTGAVEIISAHDPLLPGRTANGLSLLSAYPVSRDGQFVAFASDANNLVPGDTNDWRDIFVCDLAAGLTRLVSGVASGGGANGQCSEPAISADGRFVAFASAADNLVAGDTNRNQDVLVHDLQSGATTLASVNQNGSGSGNNASYSPILSENGRFLLFRSKATNLAPGSYTSASENLFLRDLQTATTYALTTAGVSSASMTPDGHYIALVDTPGLTAGKYRIWDAFSARAVLTNTALLGVSSIAISPDGNRVAYWAGSGAVQLYVAELWAGTTWPVILGPSPTSGATLRFSRDGQVLAYSKVHNAIKQVFACDLQTRTNLLLSTRWRSADPANGVSDSPAISADGRFVAYRSSAEDIVANDGNGMPDVFLCDRFTGVNTLLSASGRGEGGGDNRSLLPVFSADGTVLLLESWASDLVSNDFNQYSDVFAYTLLTAAALPGTAGQGPVIAWPFVSGTTYKVEYRDQIQGATWLELAGPYTNSGMRAYLQDATPSPTARFYRVRAF